VNYKAQVQVLKEIIGNRTISFFPVLARMVGTANAGLFLSQAIFHTCAEGNHPDRQGWFYNTQDDWTDETCLTRWEQEGARKLLRRYDFWEEERRGSPAKLWFRVDMERLYAAVDQYAEKPHSRMRETGEPDGGKSSNKVAEKPRTLKGTESSSEITTERAAPDRPSQDTRRAADPQADSERQFNRELKALSKDKSLPKNAWPGDSLRADLFGGLHSGFPGKTGMHQIAKVFHDSQRLEFQEQLRECVRVGVTVLALSRNGKLGGLDTSAIEARASAKLVAAGERLRIFKSAKDFEARSRMVTQYIARIVSESAAEACEADGQVYVTAPTKIAGEAVAASVCASAAD
jgi:hypothetical protein